MIFSQKKSESLGKGSRAITIVFCLLLLMFAAAGCGKVEKPVPVQLSSGNVEELQNGTAGGNEDDTKNTVEKTSRTDEERDANEDNKVPAGQDDSPDENIQQTKDTQPQSIGSEELEGNVRSIGADTFVVARIEVWSEGDVSYAAGAAPGYEDEEDLITVHVNQNCVWEFKTVKNSGINPEDVSTGEGSFADLKEGIAVSIKGSWQDDGSFLADNIEMMRFV